MGTQNRDSTVSKDAQHAWQVMIDLHGKGHNAGWWAQPVTAADEQHIGRRAPVSPGTHAPAQQAPVLKAPTTAQAGPGDDRTESPGDERRRRAVP